MITLRIEHAVSQYDAWKKAFESDPLNRKASGVIQYRLYRPVEDEKYVVIELDFRDMDEALAMQNALHKMFGVIEGKLIFQGKTRLYHCLDSTVL